MKTLINRETKYLIKDESKDFHCEFGVISKDSFKLSKATTNKGTVFSVFDAGFIDIYEKIKRKAQIITLKDIGTIIAFTGVNKTSKVLEAGSGSGSLTCMLANLAKHITSYDLRDDHQDFAKENAKTLDLDNIDFKIGDVRESIPEKNIDIAVLDMPDPWVALDSMKSALVQGGYLVIYSPTVPQIMDTVNKINESYKDDFIVITTVENIQRPWEIDGRKVRPASSYINHTGFLCFIRKI